MAGLASHIISSRMNRQSPSNQEMADRVTAERRSDYEPVDKVPFPNSSRMISERSVQFLKANETWLRSIMKADCSCGKESSVRCAQ